MRAPLTCQALVLALGIGLAGVVGAQSAQNRAAKDNVPQAPSDIQTSAATPPAPQSSQAPMGGSAFGGHVSGMAPAHAIDHRRMFGECVSAMAQGWDCNSDLVP
jgi:hypothetical protein